MCISLSLRRLFAPALLVFVLLVIEFMDELVGSTREASLPLIRDALNLNYDQIGLLLALPMVVGNLLEPMLYLYADTGKQRRLIVIGGVLFGLSVAGYAISQSFLGLMIPVLVFYTASGMFVNISQAMLMDSEPARREQNMARWTFAGSIGVVGGPLLLSAGLALGGDWRVLFVLLGGVSLVVTLWVSRMPFPAHLSEDDDEQPESLIESAKSALQALRNGEVRRWLVLLQFSDLMLDVLLSYMALYMVDVVGVSEAEAALALAVWTGVGLVGDALLIPLLERINGLSYLRVSVVIEALLFPLFLLVPDFYLKLALLAVIGFFNAGWYAILQARLYGSMHGQSGAALALGNLAGVAGGLSPFLIGFAAERVGLQVAIWLIMLGPVALIIGLRGAPEKPEFEVELE